MANTILTHQMVARQAAKVLEEEAPFLSTINKGRQEEFGEAVNGYQKGDTVKIMVPPTGRVFNGATFAEGGSATDVKETYVNLTLDTQKHVALQFGAKEKLLDITDFRERILRPQMRTLSSVVEADLLSRAYAKVPALVGSAGSVPTAMKTYAQARQKLQETLTPEAERYVVFSPKANVELVDASKALFHARQEIERGFLRGYLGEAQGMEFFEHLSVPLHTNGSQVASLVLSANATEGITQIGVSGGSGTNTIKAGSVFTVGTIKAVHPLTGVALADNKQFVVTEDLTLSAGAGTLKFWPAMNASAPNKTISALPTSSTALTFIGSASTAYVQNLAYHKDAFTTAFAPLPVLASCEGYTARLPSGVSVRVMTFGDGNNDYERTRVDVLYGFAAPRPEHACRITE